MRKKTRRKITLQSFPAAKKDRQENPWKSLAISLQTFTKLEIRDSF
jgi:hypothetical protein